MPSILWSNAIAPVAQLVRASDRNSEDSGLNPGWISMSFFLHCVDILSHWGNSLVRDSDSLNVCTCWSSQSWLAKTFAQLTETDLLNSLSSCTMLTATVYSSTTAAFSFDAFHCQGLHTCSLIFVRRISDSAVLCQGQLNYSLYAVLVSISLSIYRAIFLSHVSFCSLSW